MAAPPPPLGAVPISSAPPPPPGAVPLGGDSTIRPMTPWERVKQNFTDIGQAAHGPLTLLHELNRNVAPFAESQPGIPPSMIGGVSRIAPEGATVANALRLRLGGMKMLPAVRQAWESAGPGTVVPNSLPRPFGMPVGEGTAPGVPYRAPKEPPAGFRNRPPASPSNEPVFQPPPPSPIEPLPGTLNPAMHGPIGPVQPYSPPPNVSFTRGTIGTPPQTAEGVPLKQLGEDLIPMYTDTAEPIPMPGNPETAAALKAKFEGPAANIPADIPERYHAHFQKLGGEVGTREAMAKDSTIANYLLTKKNPVTPEQWEAAPTADKIKWMKEANPKYRFASGSRSRQEADFTKHVADTMREMRPAAIPPVGPVQPQAGGMFPPPMWPPLPPVLQ